MFQDEDDWDSNLWFTSLDDFHTPKCALGRSDKHDKYFVKAQSHRKHFLMHVWHKGMHKLLKVEIAPVLLLVRDEFRARYRITNTYGCL